MIKLKVEYKTLKKEHKKETDSCSMTSIMLVSPCSGQGKLHFISESLKLAVKTEISMYIHLIFLALLNMRFRDVTRLWSGENEKHTHTYYLWKRCRLKMHIPLCFNSILEQEIFFTRT